MALQKKTPRTAISIRLTPQQKERYYKCKDWVRQTQGTSMNKFGVQMVMNQIQDIEWQMKEQESQDNGRA